MASRKPKSPIDDVAKWILQHGDDIIKSAGLSVHTNPKKAKRFARGIGYDKEYVKTIGPKVQKSKKVPPKVKEHLENMSDKRQDKYARVFGDSNNPHEYFGVTGSMASRAKQRELNKRFSAAWSEEEAIGRANARKTASRSPKPKYQASRPTKKQAAARKVQSERLKAEGKARQKAKQAAKKPAARKPAKPKNVR